MESVCNIYMNGEVAGKATIEKEGLYYRISCACDLPKEEIYKVFAITSAGEVNLGVCRPCKTKMCLETRVSAQRMGNTIPKFHAVPKHGNLCEFHEVVSEQPFDDLTILRDCRFVMKDGISGLIRALRP